MKHITQLLHTDRKILIKSLSHFLSWLHNQPTDRIMQYSKASLLLDCVGSE